jgi:hypothetical protein
MHSLHSIWDAVRDGTFGKLGKKQLVSSAWERTCTSVVGGQKGISQAQCDDFGPSTIFPGLITTWHFPVSATKKCSERTTIRELPGSQYKYYHSSDRSIKKWVPRMLPEALRTLAKACHYPRELLWRNVM